MLLYLREKTTRDYWKYFGLLALFNLLDVILTVTALSYGAAEINPIVQPFVYTPYGLYIYKTIGLSMIALITIRRGKHPTLIKTLKGGVYFYFGVVIWNTFTVIVQYLH